MKVMTGAHLQKTVKQEKHDVFVKHKYLKKWPIPMMAKATGIHTLIPVEWILSEELFMKNIKALALTAQKLLVLSFQK